MTLRLVIGCDLTAEELYAIGIPVSLIAEASGVNRAVMKGRIRRMGWERNPDRYAEGVRLLARPAEEYRPTDVPGYWVSNEGRVLAMLSKPGTLRTPEIDQDGYLRVNLVWGATTKHRLVHRLVAEAFIGAAPEDCAIAHNNGRRDDNRVENLRWATQAENVADKIGHGTAQVGSKHGSATTDEKTIARFKRYRLRGYILREAADAVGISFYIAADVSRGKTWRHVQ